MKNTQIAVGQVIVGKANASVVVKVADMDQAMMMNVLTQAMAGQTVGITPRNPHNKKEHVEEVNAIVDDLNAKLQLITATPASTRAAGETPVAQQASQNQTKGEVKEMTNNNKQVEVQASRVEHKVMDRAARNANVGRFQSHAETVAEQRFIDLGEYDVRVLSIEWFNRRDNFNRVGAVTIKLPVGYADVRFYDRVQRQSYWYDFCDFSMNQFQPSFNPADGNGELKLAIKEGKDGQLYVTLPKSEYNGEYYDRIKCRDIRFGMAHSDNNRSLEAAVTAFIRFFAQEFVQANPKNRHGIEEHCGGCKFNMYVPGYDGMDNEAEGYKNTLNTSDTIEMVQWGEEIPRRYCMVNRELVDLEVVKEINELLANDINEYYDAEGVLRYKRPNEIVVAGKAVNRYSLLKEGTMDRCAGCAFYHNNQAKTEKQIAKEKSEGAEYVSKYWSEDARPERMPIQTLITAGKGKEWVTSVPGEIDAEVHDVRVYGIGGVCVYPSDEVFNAMIDGGVLDFIPMTEEEQVVETRGAKIINIIHHTCNNYANVSEDTLNQVMDLIDNKPQGLSNRMEKRWEKAVARLADTIQSFQG